MKFFNITDADIHELHESLHYLKMAELKTLCEQNALSTQGNKVSLIARIVEFFRTGKKLLPPSMPSVSKASSYKHYPLDPSALMLYGSYKNDAKTRAFFKQLIGNHFHFTAFGIDWLNERWFAGNPPTYAEFAIFWEQENAARKKQAVPPKKEWAYINFTQRFLLEFPHASKSDVIIAWEKERLQRVAKVKKILHLQ